MDEDVAIAQGHVTHERHEPLAALGPVAGPDVHVLANEAAGTVIGVTSARHPFPAVFAGKIFFIFDKPLGH
jgi:hypothetical protein